MRLAWSEVWGDGDLRSVMTAITCHRPRWCGVMAFQSRVGTMLVDLGEMVHVVGSAPRRKRIVGQMIVVVHHPVGGIEECFHMPPRALGRVRISERRRT